jgi:hypothetical protein
MVNLLKQQELIYKDEDYEIIGAAMAVREFEPGLLEADYL